MKYALDTNIVSALMREKHAQLRVEGRPRGILDGQIAAIAVTRGCILVTRNVSDFEHYNGLHIESWVD